MATEARLANGVIRKYSPVLQAQDQSLSQARVRLKDPGSSENKELSDLWDLVSELVTSPPVPEPPLWEEPLGSSPLQVIREETASDCAQFSRSTSPSLSNIETSQTPIPLQSLVLPKPSWSDRSEFISSTPWLDRCEFLSSTNTSIKVLKINTSLDTETQASPISTHHSKNPLKDTWMMSDTWLSVSDPSDLLFSSAETLFANSRYQSGLATTDVAIRSAHAFGIPDDSMEIESPLPFSSTILHGSLAKRSTITTARTINLQLMKSCALLAFEYPDRALESADLALAMSEEQKIFYMVSKSHLYRGLALMQLEKWKDASLAFTRAANVRGWATKVPALKKEADKKLQEALKKSVEKH